MTLAAQAIESAACEIYTENTQAMLEIESCLVDGGTFDLLSIDQASKFKIKAEIAQWCVSQREAMKNNKDSDGYVIPWEQLVQICDKTPHTEKVLTVLKTNCKEFANFGNPMQVAEGRSPIPPKAISDIQETMGGSVGGIFAAAADYGSELPPDSILGKKNVL